MAMIDRRWQRVTTLCALYVAQGVPWGFMLITLPSFLSYEYKVSDAAIGNLKAIILVPWSFKLIWAPIMDTFTIRSMGRRRPWIIGAELMMAATLLGFLGLGDLSAELNFILTMYFLHNCFASLQDVCTDALAVDILPFEEQGRMNGLMWGSKLIGKGVGAWGLSHVLKWGGLEACVGVQVAILLGIMLIPVLMLERPGEKRFPWSRGHAGLNEKVSNVRNPLELLADVLKAFSLQTTFVYIAFTLSKLIGVGINEVATNTLYTQQLSPRWTDVEFSTASGLYATGPIILGSIFAGFLADRYGRRFILTVGFGGYGIIALVFAALPEMWNVRWFAMSYVLSCETLGAIGSIGFLAMAMRISWTAAAATVFTTYMTLSNVSHVLGNWLAGPVRSVLSYEQTFWLVGVTAILPLVLLPFVRPSEVDEQKEREASSDDALCNGKP